MITPKNIKFHTIIQTPPVIREYIYDICSLSPTPGPNHGPCDASGRGASVCFSPEDLREADTLKARFSRLVFFAESPACGICLMVSSRGITP